MYYYSVLKSGKCKPTVPESVYILPSWPQSLDRTFFQKWILLWMLIMLSNFPKSSMMLIKFILTFFLSLLDSWNCLQSIERLFFLFLFLFDFSREGSSNQHSKPFIWFIECCYEDSGKIIHHNGSISSFFSHYQEVPLFLLPNSRFAVSEEGGFLAITDLALFSATHNLLTEDTTTAIASYFLRYHTTTRPDVAFSLLRVMAVLRSIMPSSAIAMKAEYQENQLRIHITDVEAKPRSDLFVFLREGSNDQISLHFDKNQYITNLNLEPGKHIFAVKVGVEERS